MKVRIGDILAIAIGCAVPSAVIGFILNCIVFPLAYTITHDCGKWICEHHYPMTWGSFGIITGIVFVFSFVIVVYSENSNLTYTYTKPRRMTRRKREYVDDRETDYYDSDMEGAPDYYGFD